MRLGLGLGLTRPLGDDSLASQVAALFAKYNALGVPTWGFVYGDKPTLYQDGAYTTPVSASLQQIGSVRNKSASAVIGATQTTAINRPIYTEAGAAKYAAFNGTNSSLATANIDLTSTDKLTLVLGLYKASTGIGLPLEFSTSAPANNGSFYISSNESPETFAFQVRGTVSSSPLSVAAPNFAASVLTADADIATQTRRIRLNGGSWGQVTGLLGTGNFGNWPLFVGARALASVFFNGYKTCDFGIGAILLPNELLLLEAYAASLNAGL